MAFSKEEIEAENALVSELVEMSRTLQAGLQSNGEAAVWQERRDEISVLRERIQNMREQHLGAGRRARRN